MKRFSRASVHPSEPVRLNPERESREQRASGSFMTAELLYEKFCGACWKMYLSKLQNVFVHRLKCIC